MKKLNLLLIIGLMFIVMSMSVSADLTDNDDLYLVSYWDFDIDADDSTGAYDGTNYGATASSNSINNGSYYFDGNDYITVPAGRASDCMAKNWSVSIWINVTSLHNYGNVFRTDANGAYGWGMIIFANGVFGIQLDDVGVCSLDAGTLIENQWYHIAATMNGTNINVWLNGTKIKTCASGTQSAISQPLYIGKDNYYSRYHIGHIDEFSIWNKSLNDSEITSLWNNGDGYFYPFAVADTTPPTNSTWNVTSQNLPTGENSSIWNAGGQYVINVTNNTLSLTVVTDEASNGSCMIGHNWNYTTMMLNDTNHGFATDAAPPSATSLAYLVFDNISVGNHCLYCSFIDVDGNEFANSSSGCLNITRTIPITGYVFDDLTNVIEGAIVYITNLFTNITEKVTTNVSGMYESSQGYEKGIHLISGYDPSNYSLQPDAQLVNVTE